MLDNERRDAESILSFSDDLLELRLCHLCVRRIINRGDSVSVVGVAHRSDEKRNRSECRRLHLGDQGGGGNFPADDGYASHPPETGGIRATSSRESTS